MSRGKDIANESKAARPGQRTVFTGAAKFRPVFGRKNRVFQRSGPVVKKPKKGAF